MSVKLFCYLIANNIGLITPYSVFLICIEPNQSNDFVVLIFLKAALNNECLYQQTRSFCYVKYNVDTLNN